ncbi:MAG: Cna B-type domain-containing protein [Bacillota bacterium]|nr:Cna B-type domain-containing protein [Bacillota bacterium]
MKAKRRGKLIAVIVTLVLVLPVLFGYALSYGHHSGGGSGQQPSSIGPQVVYTGGERTANLVEVEKTIEQVKTTGGEWVEDTFDITLKVTTTQDLTSIPTDKNIAVALVIDTSVSMQWDAAGGGYCTGTDYKGDDCPLCDGDDEYYHIPANGHNSGDSVYAAEDEQRISAAISAANAFIADYAASASSASYKRLLSIVHFATDAKRQMNWTELSGLDDNIAAAQDVVSGLKYKLYTGTNIQAGLQLAKNNIDAHRQNDGTFKDDLAGIDEVYVILLSDGAPNKRIASQRNSLTEIKGENVTDTGVDVATSLKRSGVTIYTIAFAASAPDLSSIANSGCALTAANATTLANQFKAISENIAIWAEAWMVTDPMGANIKFDSILTEGATGVTMPTDDNNDQLIWDLRKATPTTTGGGKNNQIWYNYELKYQVTLDTTTNFNYYASVTDGKDRGDALDDYNEIVDNDRSADFRADEKAAALIAKGIYPTNDATVLDYAILNNGVIQGGKQTINFKVPTVIAFEPVSVNAVTSFTVNKLWDHGNNPAANQPTELVVQLYRGSGQTATPYGDPVTLSANTDPSKNWTYTWNSLPYDDYSVTETEPDNYTMTVVGDPVPKALSITSLEVVNPCNELAYNDLSAAFIMVNKGNNTKVWTQNTLTDTQKTAFVTAFNAWKQAHSNANQLGSITVNDFVSGTSATITMGNSGNRGSVTITVGNDGKLGLNFSSSNAFSKFAYGAYDANGKIITLTNTYTPPATEWTVNKEWKGDTIAGIMENGASTNAYFKLRPASVTFDIIDDPEKEQPTKIIDNQSLAASNTPAGNWTTTVSLPVAYDDLTGDYIKEDVPVGYTDEVAVDNGDKIITITNTLKTINVTLSKVWDDTYDSTEDYFGLRPDSVTVYLYHRSTTDGITTDTKLGSYELKKDTDPSKNYKLSVTLPKYIKIGNDIVEANYVFIEEVVPGYKPAEAVITDGSTAGSYTATLTNTLDLLSFPVYKIWDDGVETNGVTAPSADRPATITFVLQKGEVVNGEIEWSDVEEQEVASGSAVNTSTLMHTFYAPKLDGVSYRVVEKDVPLYSTIVTLPDTNTNTNTDTNTYAYTFTNSLKHMVQVTKTWLDNDNAYTTRPDILTIQLLANGAPVGVQVDLNEGNGWQYVFKGLDKYNTDGITPIVYTVEELNLPSNYTNVTPASDPLNLVNLLSEDIELTITKKWVDFPTNYDYPESLDFALYINDVRELGTDGVEIVHTISGSADGSDWTESIGTYPKYDKQGAEISYRIVELTVSPNYSTVCNGMTATNTYSTPIIPEDPPPGPGPDQPIRIPDPVVPQTDTVIIEEPAPTTDITTIIEEDVPLADVPPTGDSAQLYLWLALGALALAGVVVFGRRRSRG